MKNISGRNLRGFTLIELLVVVLIIGILAAIALPQYTFAVEKARLTEVLTNIKSFSDQWNAHYMATGEDTIPNDLIELGSAELAESGYYESQKFHYYIAACQIHVWPADEVSSYEIHVHNCEYGPEGMEGLNKYKSCDVYNDLGYKICKFLESQGYELSEMR